MIKTLIPKARFAGMALAVGLLVSACANPDGAESTPDTGTPVESSAPTSETSAETEAETISLETGQFINPLPQHPVWKMIGDCMVEEGQAQGIDFIQSGPSGQAVDVTVMTQQVQQATAASKDVIVTFPASEAFAPLLQQAMDAGSITITMYGDGGPDSGAYTNVGANWTRVAEDYVAAIAERDGEQNVGLIAHSDTGLGKAWMDGMKAAAAETTNVKIVGEVYTADDSAKAVGQATALLTSHPEINVLASHMGTATQGTVSAIKNLGLSGDVVFVGNGPDSGGKEALEDGTAYRMMIQNLCSAGQQAVTVAIMAAEGEALDETYDVETQMASAENVDELMEKGWR